jgi:cyanophycinase-like exopeptidase
MVKTHRAIFESLGPDPVPAVLLDTPYGFQANAADISARAVDYFATSLGRRVDLAELRDAKRDDPLRRQEGLARVAAARWVFAGPGSPSYALRQWRQTDVPGLLADKLAHGGAVVFASAAALTLGRHTVPVYEIYKVGDEPAWLDGLNLLGFLGPEVAVIPHYDNAEGGNHDTRFCYLGEERLARLESQMGPHGWVLGIDEHTGCVLDLDAGTATVVGNGTVTLRKSGISRVLDTGTVIAITDMVELATAIDPQGPESTQPVSTRIPGLRTYTANGGGSEAVNDNHGLKDQARGDILSSETRRLQAAFDLSIVDRDVDGAVRALLELDETLSAW